jgi:hypothetical protein
MQGNAFFQVAAVEKVQIALSMGNNLSPPFLALFSLLQVYVKESRIYLSAWR